MTHIHIAAHELKRRLNQLEVHIYRLKFSSPSPELESNPLRLTRRGAKQLAYANKNTAVTDFGAWYIASLEPLSTLSSNWDGLLCTATVESVLTLESHDQHQREVIKRLLNQCLYLGAKNLAKNSGGAVLAELTQGNIVELIDEEPSERIQIKSEYLDAFQTVALHPEVLPDGRVLVGYRVKHRLMAKPAITLDWVIRRKPEWLAAIKRVRHRYYSRGKKGTASFIATAEQESTASIISCSQGEVSLLQYHVSNGNIHENECGDFADSHIVKVKYGKAEALHLAKLLEPMFDFETLQLIDSRLLEKLAQNLKWSVTDRLKAAGRLTRNLYIPLIDSGMAPIEGVEDFTKRINAKYEFEFANRQRGSSEQDVMKFGAFQGMTRKRIVSIVIGAHGQEALDAEDHFKSTEGICRQWSETDPLWQATKPASDANDLEQRLAQRTPEETLLLIGLGRGADKQAIRNVAFRYGLATQFMRLDHPAKRYTNYYYGNVAAGVFTKAGGIICAIKNMPGDTDLFIGLDLGGVSQRKPGLATLFTRQGAQLGWQLVDAQKGERVDDATLHELLTRSYEAFVKANEGQVPRRIALHRDGPLYESLDVIRAFEVEKQIGIDVLEVRKSGSPTIFRKKTVGIKSLYRNPEVGDAFVLPGLDQMILATYSGAELGKTWGESATVRSLRLCKRHGETDLHTLAEQVILLSRIHGSSLYRHPRLPVTTHHADRFATLRLECNLDDLSKMDRQCPVYL